MTERTTNIRASKISKRYLLRRGPRAILNLLFSAAKADANVIHAVRNVDLVAQSGEIVGVIGRNGSGKSTFLRVLAGLLEKDGGEIGIHGRVIYLSGLSFSTDPYMTVRENIHLIGTVLGLRRREIRSKVAQIVEFAGLAPFLDVEAFKLSSGMQVRLNVATIFSCMEHVRPNVLLMDEVLSAGGDIEFQKKSMAKVEGLLASGATVIMASHDLPFVERFCRRVLWLEEGAVRKEGSSAEIVAEYVRTYA